MGFIELRNCPEIIEPGARQVLFSLNILENDANTELSPLSGEAEALLSGVQAAPRGGYLIPQRLPMNEGFDDLPDKIIPQFFDPELCDRCPRRAQCTDASPGHGRTVSIADNEALQKRLQKLVRAVRSFIHANDLTIAKVDSDT